MAAARNLYAYRYPMVLEGGAIELDGKGSMIKYKLLTFPELDFTVSIWVSVTRLPSTNYGQVFSAWAGGMDDPLRLVVQGGKLHARIEAGRRRLDIRPGHQTQSIGGEITRRADLRADRRHY